MSWSAYARHSYTWPYIANISTSHGELFYFGAKHSNDPLDSQFSEIETNWERLKPDIAFNEGGNPPTEKTRDEAIKKYGEPGLIRFLAARDKIPVRSIDPTTAEEVAELRKQFSPEQLKIFYILRQMTEYGRIIQPTDSRDEYLRTTIAFLGTIPGLDVSPRYASELESEFARHFPKQGTYTDANPTWFDPVATGTVFNQISRSGSEFRDKHMVFLLSKIVCEQKRIFAVVGGSHVVMQEPAIRKLLSEKCP